jgi:ABC-type molybdate transport system permease subunit
MCEIDNEGGVSTSRIIFAGTPAATTLLGNDFVTTALAPMVTLFPITIPPSILAPAPIVTLSPIVGRCLIIDRPNFLLSTQGFV